VDDRTAERRAEEGDDQLTTLPEAVLALPFPVDGERRIAEQPRRRSSTIDASYPPRRS
jgi:hypothetical protein